MIRKLRDLPLLLLLLVAAFTVGAAQSKGYFVSNSGNSSNSGLSATQPWDMQTLQSKSLNAGDIVAFQC